MKQQLITRVLVTVMVDGRRQDIPPGKPLPDGVHEHDIAQLLRMRAIEDVAATATAEKDAAIRAKADGADFDEARKAVQAAQASITAAEPVVDADAEAEAQAKAEAEAQAKAEAETKAKGETQAKGAKSGKKS